MICASRCRAAASSSGPRTCCATSARSSRRPPPRRPRARPRAPTRPPPRSPCRCGFSRRSRRPCRRCARWAGRCVAPIATAGLVVVLVIFMLLQREDLRDRVLRLVGASDVARATEAMDDAAKRISRYLLMQLVINVLYGIPVGIGLYLIGVPNPILWGLLATILRFIPYLGPVIAALFPIALSFAVAPGWTLPLLTIALFVILELFSNNVLEPWLYGSSTGLSPVAVLLAAVVLDHAVGSGRAAALDAAYRLPGRPRPPCAPARFLRRAAGRRAGAGARGQVLPAPARARPGGGERAGRGVSGGRIARQAV